MTIAESTTITKSKIVSQSYANIFNLINNKNNVADPTGSTTRKMVYTRMPDLSRNFKGYPFIVVYSPTVSYTEPALSMRKSLVSWEIIIEVYSDDKTRNRIDKGLEDNEDISDDIMETLNDVDNKKQLRCYGMEFVIPDAEGLDVEYEEGNVFYIRSFAVRFRRRMLIS